MTHLAHKPLKSDGRVFELAAVHFTQQLGMRRQMRFAQPERLDHDRGLAGRQRQADRLWAKCPKSVQGPQCVNSPDHLILTGRQPLQVIHHGAVLFLIDQSCRGVTTPPIGRLQFLNQLCPRDSPEPRRHLIPVGNRVPDRDNTVNPPAVISGIVVGPIFQFNWHPLGMFDDGTIHIDNVKGSAGSHLQVDRPKPFVTRREEFDFVAPRFSHECRTRRRHHLAVDQVPGRITREHIALDPFSQQSPTIDPNSTSRRELPFVQV